mmetsp:Transcript_75074/g.244091  ORF Transcript_75074/g.244091 Transcript_75074/m.244091 type:complete len:252 (+) Transcript_75074:3251-4006(+)
MRFTEAPTICTPRIFESCACSRMARETMGKMRPKAHESTVFMKVVLDNLCSASAAFSMLALSKMLSTILSDMARISGVPATSRPMCRSKTSASFFTSFLASPTASRTAIMTFGIRRPSCLGVASGSPILWIMSFKMVMQATLTFHLPAAAAPKCSSNTGITSSGTHLPPGPPLVSSWQRSTAVPPGSDLSLTSSKSISTAGMLCNTAGGFHSSARMVRRAKSRVGTRLSCFWMLSIPAEIMDGTSALTSLL